jgi:hypothetical protein
MRALSEAAGCKIEVNRFVTEREETAFKSLKNSLNKSKLKKGDINNLINHVCRNR